MAPTDDARGRLAAATFRPVWIVLAAVAAIHVLGIRVPRPIQYAVLLSTVLVLGLPHGALDHLTLPRARDRAVTLRGVAVFSVAYLAVAGAYGLAWLLAPTASFVGFVLLTWFHWGQGDRAHLAVIADASHLDDRLIGWLTLLVRGGLPMMVPLIGFPDAYESVARTVVGLFDPAGGAGWLGLLFEPTTRLALGLGFALLTLATLALGYRAVDDRRGWQVDALETALLWVFFLTVPPVLAVGIYFVVWHSLRHLARLITVDDVATTALARGATDRLLARVGRDALPMTAGALVLFGALAVVVPNEPGSLAGVGGVYLVLLAVLTLPHAGVVTALDRIQGVS
ncbi:Brp/Blh family beta-carotene 15,15'-dioxygenase [Halapricum hydrolyticum]|uniref:Probable beta-carotene 15,15'-dioxygenase n=1 Tax=Halapricum hydrolyticum TaxID=2979991 RepID=A0AAE3LJ65_9EURY|nr:Brp/Blh family beta-carotene 15,15'-dioxygenase [Halapricum hydrolyticum]MCU4717859.1 Brp/Blh family beta-carotene 15,15'-dioxygenase [Halapricum hydrolyticum]MCU4727023.1 Brp/Blh family beta-carotene 15,15'-dioxygenase [Halapricum hydrolyticum]